MYVYNVSIRNKYFEFIIFKILIIIYLVKETILNTYRLSI